MQQNRPYRNRGGLPPAPRSRKDEPSTSYSREPSSRSNGASSSRQVRPQRSMASISPARNLSNAPPPTPQPRQTSRSNKSVGGYESPSMNPKDSGASSSSMSSTASAFLDRLRGGGDMSSRTSLEEEYESPKQRRGQDPDQDSHSFGQGREDSTLTAGVGSILWSRLASAAGTLGVDVGKAWATNITMHSGEDTPPGKESRLTQAMKAYHLEKARDPSDLPEWLFEEHERRPVGRSRFASRQNTRQADGYEESTPAPRSRGLRDIYDAAAAPRTSGIPDRQTYNRFLDEPAAPSKATNRLKALRDAKRLNSNLDEETSVRSTSISSDGRGAGDGKRRDRGVAEVSDRKPPPRVGLPSRPGGGSRRV